jgi:hypothetical protein
VHAPEREVQRAARDVEQDEPERAEQDGDDEAGNEE